MPPGNLLIDSSYLFAFFGVNNAKHTEAVLAAELHRGQFVVPDVVLTEVAFLFNRAGGIPAVLQFLDRLIAMQPRLESVSVADLARVREIMTAYADSNSILWTAVSWHNLSG